MQLRCPPARALLLCEELEQRQVLSTLTVPVQSAYGDQIVTVQAYQNIARTAFGIFDTGSSALTFAAHDQASFIAKHSPIPIKYIKARNRLLAHQASGEPLSGCR